MDSKSQIKRNDSRKVVILGGGAAGLSAAVYLARAHLEPLIFAGSPPGGQLMLTTEVENFPGVLSVNGPQLNMNMREQAQKFGADIRDENIVQVDFSRHPYLLYPSSSKPPISTEAVIIATGAKALWLGLDAEKRLRGRGISACATCDGFFFRDKVVGVVGGGDSALEEALTLTKFAKQVILIHRRGELRASKIMQERVRSHPHIHLLLNTQILDILGTNRVEGAKVIINPSDSSLLTKTKEEIEKKTPELLHMKILEKTATSVTGTIVLDGIFVAIGHKPDTDILKNQIALDAKGYVITTNRLAEMYLRGETELTSAQLDQIRSQTYYGTATNKKGVFAAGDCVDKVYRQASTAAGMGVAASLDAEKWLEQGLCE